jgi:hypothetical protein
MLFIGFSKETVTRHSAISDPIESSAMEMASVNVCP